MLYPNNHAVKNSIANQCNHYYAGYPEDRIYSLALVSGGLDSVALLANLLQHTKHKVHAHFVEMVNHENRSNAEKAAMQKCVNYLIRHYRPFEYSTSVYEMMLGEPKWVGPDISAVMFMAGRLCKSLGNNMDMIWTGHMRGPVYEYVDAGAVLAASFSSLLKKPLWVMPLTNFLKFDIHESIPKELADLTWSCRFPKYDAMGNATPCGECHACGGRMRIQVMAQSVSETPPQLTVTLENADPSMSAQAASALWPCMYPRYDAGRHVMRCGVCSNCHTLVEFEHSKRQRPAKASG